MAEIEREQHMSGLKEMQEMTNILAKESNRQALTDLDEESHPHTWDELKHILEKGDLALLRRSPLEVRRYLRWTSVTIDEYGSAMNYISKRRLHWEPLSTSEQPSSTAIGLKFAYRDPTPFADPDDYKVLINDWPYDLTPDIRHLVVWLKTPIPVNSADGGLTDGSKKLIEAFIHSTFVKRLESLGIAEDRVLWFKNPAQLQSIGGIEHVHVLLRDVPEDIVTEWTGKE